jgi:hypothetical protein
LSFDKGEKSFDEGAMFIRFVSGQIDERSHVSAGLFCAVCELRYETTLPDYESDRLAELMGWFNCHLEAPFDYRLRSPWRARRSICWFRSSAHEHLARAREVVQLLEGHDIFMRTVKSRRTGYVLYEDEFQVLAEPFADMRDRL